MAPSSKALGEGPSDGSGQALTTTPYRLDPTQTLRAASALSRNIQQQQATAGTPATGKADLLADADTEHAEDSVPIWLVLTTKKHIVDKKRLKPGKIHLPHPLLDWRGDNELRLCLITADPQRTYKDLIASPVFNPQLSKRISRVIGLTKLKAKYKTFESRRQLMSEHDVFLADDRVITYLPTVLGKVFYERSAKRPIPVSLEGQRQSMDERGNKRQKLSEGGTKVVKKPVRPEDAAREIIKALESCLVHLSPSTTTALRVGLASQTPEQIQENVETVSAALIGKYVSQQWKAVRSVHIKGPNTAALPIWMATELWEDEADVLDEAPPVKEGKKRNRNALTGNTADGDRDAIIVRGGDGQLRRVEAPATQENNDIVKRGQRQRKTDLRGGATEQPKEKAEKDARKAALQAQKHRAKKAVGEYVSSMA